MIKGLVYVPVGRGKQAIIDAEDAIEVASLRWNMDSKGYPCARYCGGRISMHHLVKGEPPQGLVTDHINRNPLDNRKINLRHVTQSTNMINRSLSSRNKSGYVGVYWHSRQKKWCAKVRRNNKDIHVGYYDTPEEANKHRLTKVALIDEHTVI